MPATVPSRPKCRTRRGLLALADRCVQCGLCLPHCPDLPPRCRPRPSPRGAASPISRRSPPGAWLRPAAGDLHLDHCLGCRRCERRLPGGCRLRRAAAGRARGAQRQRRGNGVRTDWHLLAAGPAAAAGLFLARTCSALHRLAADGAAPPAPSACARRPTGPRDRAAGHRGRQLVRRLHRRPATRPRRGRPCCAWRARPAWRLTVPRGQGCCGAAAAHAGDSPTAARLAAANRECFRGRRARALPGERLPVDAGAIAARRRARRGRDGVPGRARQAPALPTGRRPAGGAAPALHAAQRAWQHRRHAHDCSGACPGWR